MKNIFTLLIIVSVLAISFTGCKEKKQKKVIPQKTVVKKDTVKPEPVKKVVKAPEPKKPDKYFLIRGVYEYKHRADAFYEKLVKEGYEPRVFITDDGFFYRISYMGFSDRKEAFRKLREERAKEETKDVWLYILPDSQVK